MDIEFGFKSQCVGVEVSSWGIHSLLQEGKGRGGEGKEGREGREDKRVNWVHFFISLGQFECVLCFLHVYSTSSYYYHEQRTCWKRAGGIVELWYATYSLRHLTHNKIYILLLFFHTNPITFLYFQKLSKSIKHHGFLHRSPISHRKRSTFFVLLLDFLFPLPPLFSGPCKGYVSPINALIMYICIQCTSFDVHPGFYLGAAHLTIL